MVVQAFVNLCPSAASVHTVTDIGMDCAGIDARANGRRTALMHDPKSSLNDLDASRQVHAGVEFRLDKNSKCLATS